jgi:hypothetical protein
LKFNIFNSICYSIIFYDAHAEMHDLLLVGFGPAHMALMLALCGQTSLKVCIIDPYFDGGDLFRCWSSIKSNTTWRQFTDAVAPYCSNRRMESFKAAHNQDDTVLLGDLIRSLKSVVDVSVDYLAERMYGRVVAADFADSCWTTTLADGRKVKSKVLSVAPGADPRQLIYPKPQLTLSSVLCPELSSKVGPSDRVMVFGLSHSGTLAIDALLKVGANVVAAVYNTDRPFLFDRDGVYGGIKQESAAIADRLIADGIVPLIPTTDQARLLSALLEADWAVYAVGFDGRKEILYSVNGLPSTLDYDAETGRSRTMPAAFAWGIAYPSSSSAFDRKHFDVSVPAFIAHAERNVSAVVDSCCTKTS